MMQLGLSLLQIHVLLTFIHPSVALYAPQLFAKLHDVTSPVTQYTLLEKKI